MVIASSSSTNFDTIPPQGDNSVDSIIPYKIPIKWVENATFQAETSLSSSAPLNTTGTSKLELVTCTVSAKNSDRCELEVGDHIYSWRAAGAWSHHGIVLSASTTVVAIVDFFPEQPRRRRKLPPAREVEEKEVSRLQRNRWDAAPSVQLRSLQEWIETYGRPFKVCYKAGPLRRLIHRSGTCTGRESDPTCLILARVKFLLGFYSCSHDGNIKTHLPAYHRLHSNSETAAFWCKTGHWATLQVADFLHLTFASQIKSSITIGAYASTQAISDPVSGTVGATLATSHLPIVLPLVVGYGLITVGGPLWMLRQCQSQWNNITSMLHENFWSTAPCEVFVQCIQYWTNLDQSK